MKILSWNIRGVGRKGFTQEVSDFIKFYRPNMIFIMENKVNTIKVEGLLKD